MWELDYKESWAPKNWCFWTVVLEKTLESPLDSKEIQPVHPKGDQSWIFIGRTDVVAEAPILWPPDVKSWLIGKGPDAGKHWRWEEKGMTEDEMVGWHHWLDGHGFEQALGDGDGQGGLACCSPRYCWESGMTGRVDTNYIPHKSEFIWHLPFSIWLISFSKIPPGSIRLVANGRTPCVTAEWHLMVCVCLCLYLLLPVFLYVCTTWALPLFPYLTYCK